jgi:cyclohexyl-isocyanide hydratase
MHIKPNGSSALDSQTALPATEAVHVGFLTFPDVTQLDLTGPVHVLSRVPGAHIHLLWKTLEPVMTDAGFAVCPTTRFGDCPPLDVICVPGGLGVIELINDSETLDFLRRQGAKARYVTSVCNGSVLLGAAGLLNGYDATCHWAWLHLLKHFRARPVAQRVVRDRNRWSGGGVTSGIDFALMLAAEMAGEDFAKLIELGSEYDPQPPYGCGSPDKAGPELTAKARARQAKGVQLAEQAILQATRDVVYS